MHRTCCLVSTIKRQKKTMTYGGEPKLIFFLVWEISIKRKGKRKKRKRKSEKGKSD